MYDIACTALLAELRCSQDRKGSTLPAQSSHSQLYLTFIPQLCITTTFCQAIHWCVPKSNNFSSLSASTQLSSSMNGTLCFGIQI